MSEITTIQIDTASYNNRAYFSTDLDNIIATASFNLHCQDFPKSIESKIDVFNEKKTTLETGIAYININSRCVTKFYKSDSNIINSCNGKNTFLYSTDKEIVSLDINNMKKISSFNAPPMSENLILSQDECIFALSCKDYVNKYHYSDKIMLYDMRKSIDPISIIDNDYKVDGSITTLSFNNDNIVVGTRNGTVKFINYNTLEEKVLHTDTTIISDRVNEKIKDHSIKINGNKILDSIVDIYYPPRQKYFMVTDLSLRISLWNYDLTPYNYVNCNDINYMDKILIKQKSDTNIGYINNSFMYPKIISYNSLYGFTSGLYGKPRMSNDGLTFAYSHNGSVFIYDKFSKNEKHKFRLNRYSDVTNIEFSWNDHMLLANDSSGKISIFRLVIPPVIENVENVENAGNSNE